MNLTIVANLKILLDIADFDRLQFPVDRIIEQKFKIISKS